MARFFAYLLQRRIVWKSLAILVLEVAIVIYQKKNSSLNVVELWVTKETDESEVQSALRKYQQQGIFVCIFQVIDQLCQILNGINVMMWRRGDQADTRS